MVRVSKILECTIIKQGNIVMSISVNKTRIKETKIIVPNVYGDVRGYFMESWNSRDFTQVAKVSFVQDN